MAPRIARVAGPRGRTRSAVCHVLRDAGLEPVADHPAPDLTVLVEDAPRAPWPPPPVIVVSSRADIDSFTNAITSGAAAYFTAPVDAAALAAAARRLSRWRAGDPEGNTRRAPRRPLLLDVDVERDGRRFRARLVDVSAAGCRLETAARVKRGERLTIVPRALGASTGIALGAVVTWTRADAGGRVCTVAARFSSTSALLAPRIFGAVPAARSPRAG